MTTPLEIASVLRSKFGLSVPNDWLTQCVEWLNSQAESGPLENEIYTQWLLTDLRGLYAGSSLGGCLPREICTTMKYELNGQFCLQLNGIRDVHVSAYSQLSNLQGRESENVQVSAEDAFTPRTQKAGGRLLHLYLTDGISEVTAVELSRIPCLHEDLPPGTKVMLSGKMTSRVGVIFLTAGNISLLGGEVDEMRLPHSREAVLCSTLGLPPPDVHVGSPRVNDSLVTDEDLLALTMDLSPTGLKLPPQVITTPVEQHRPATANANGVQRSVHINHTPSSLSTLSHGYHSLPDGGYTPSSVVPAKGAQVVVSKVPRMDNPAGSLVPIAVADVLPNSTGISPAPKPSCGASDMIRSSSTNPQGGISYLSDILLCLGEYAVRGFFTSLHKVSKFPDRDEWLIRGRFTDCSREVDCRLSSDFVNSFLTVTPSQSRDAKALYKEQLNHLSKSLTQMHSLFRIRVIGADEDIIISPLYMAASTMR